MFAFPLLIGALMSGAAPQAPARVPRLSDCLDDRGVDRCAVKQQARVRELFGVRPIADHARRGDQLRRVFYVDGYGHDIVAIEFVRPPGGDPALIVRFPDAQSKEGRKPLTAPVPLAAWDEVVESSAHFDRELVKPAEQAGNDIRLCLHSWVYTAESVDPPRENRPAEIRRRTEDACNDGLTEAFAWKLVKVAVKLIPPCDLLSRHDYRNEAVLLSSCGILSGDRLTAAAVLNRIKPLRHSLEEGDAPAWAELFEYRATVTWAGESSAGSEDAAKFWTEHATGHGRTDLFIDRIVGESATRAKLRGTLFRSVKGAGYEQADVEQLWELEGSGAQIHEATVGPFKPVKP